MDNQELTPREVLDLFIVRDNNEIRTLSSYWYDNPPLEVRLAFVEDRLNRVMTVALWILQYLSDKEIDNQLGTSKLGEAMNNQ